VSNVSKLFNDESSQNAVFDGIIMRDVEGVSDLAPVVVPAFDPSLEFCRAPWMPRGDTLPAEGDRCVVVLAETDEPGTPEPWIVAWWPYGD
jgi:hypothetical protein